MRTEVWLVDGGGGCWRMLMSDNRMVGSWRTSLNWELRRKYYGDHYGDYGGNYGDLCGGPDLPDRLAGRGLIQNPLGLTYYMFICIILLHNDSPHEVTQIMFVYI